MKKFTKLMLFVVCALCLAVFSAGCGGSSDSDDSSSEPHTHVAGSELFSDSEFHWNKCECGEIMNKTAHSFTELDVAAQPAKTAYTVGETFDKTGMKIEGKCVCGNVEITDYTVAYQTENAQAFAVSDTHVIVKYGELSVNASVVVSKIKIAKPAADTKDFVYSGAEQTYTIAENERYTVSGNKQTNAGSYTVTVALSDKTNASWADGSDDDLTYTFVIAKADNAIEWAKGEDDELISLDITYGQTPNPQATATSGTVTFTYANKDKTETGGWSEVYKGAAQYYCIAAVAESGNYNAVTDERLFTVFKADNIIEWAKGEDDEYISLDVTYPAEPAPQATATSGTVTFTYANKDKTETGSWSEVYKGAAQYYCIAAVAESNNYNAVTDERLFTVFKADNAIEWAKNGDEYISLDVTYPAEPAPQATATSGTVTFTYANKDKTETGGWSEVYKGAAQYYCIATVAESDNYKAVTDERLFTVFKADNAITFEKDESGNILSLDFTFGGKPIENTATALGGATITYTYTLANKDCCGDVVEPEADAVYSAWSDDNATGLYKCKITAAETDNYNSVTAERWVRFHKREADENGVKYTYDATNDCYYVSGYSGSKAEVTVLEKFNDGANGEKAVTYVKLYAFQNNTDITKVELPESIVDLDGSVFFGCTNLKYVYMTGVKTLNYGKNARPYGTRYGNNNFFNCINLETVIVSNAFSSNVTQFGTNNDSAVAVVRFFVNGASGTPSLQADKLLTGEVYYKVDDTEEVKCAQWKFGENGEIVHGASEHSFVDGVCKICGEVQSKTITYAYDSTNECYYVTGVSAATESELYVRATYNDGTNDEKAVTYVKNNAFTNNTTIKKVILPDSIKSLDGGVFMNCTNLEYVSMTGVENLDYNGSNLGFGSDRNNNFMNCTAMKYVILNPNFKTNVQQFFLNGSTPEKAILDIYVNAASGTPSFADGTNQNLFTENIYYYSETELSGAWHYDNGVPALW